MRKAKNPQPKNPRPAAPAPAPTPERSWGECNENSESKFTEEQADKLSALAVSGARPRKNARRCVRIGLCLPATATLIVQRVGDDWQIVEVVSVESTTLSPRGVGEHMTEECLSAMDIAAEEAEDLP